MGARALWLVVLLGCSASDSEDELARGAPPRDLAVELPEPDPGVCSRDKLSVVYCVQAAGVVLPATTNDRLVVFVDPSGSAVAAWAADTGDDCTDTGEGCHETMVLSRLGPDGRWSPLGRTPNAVHVVGWPWEPTHEAWALPQWRSMAPERCYAMPDKPEGFEDYAWELEPWHIDPCGDFTFAGTLGATAAFVRVEGEAVVGIHGFGDHLWDHFASLAHNEAGRAVGLVRELPAPDPRNANSPLGPGLWAAVLDPAGGLSEPVRVFGDEVLEGDATSAVDAAGNVLIGWDASIGRPLPDGSLERRRLLITRLLRAGADPQSGWDPPVVHYDDAQPGSGFCHIEVRAVGTGFEVDYVGCGENLPRGPWKRQLDLDDGWSDPVEVVDPGKLQPPAAPPAPGPGEYLLTLASDAAPADGQGPWPALQLSRVDERTGPKLIDTLVSEPGGEITIRGGVVDRSGRTVLLWLEAEGPVSVTESFGDCNPPAGTPAEGCFTETTYSHTRVHSVVIEPDGELTVVPLPEMTRRSVVPSSL